MGLTLRQAADLCGASRSTIHRALKSGKLSGNRLEDGAWDIDPSELARVFPWAATLRKTVTREVDQKELVGLLAELDAKAQSAGTGEP